MRKRAENLFTFYRGPSSRDAPEQVGRQLEDNATAGLLKLLTEVGERDPDVAVEILRALVPTDPLSDSLSFECEDQVSVASIESSGRQVNLVGLSTTGLGSVNEINSDEEGSDGTVDAVISFDSGPTIVLEVKTKGDPLRRGQLEEYAGEIGLENTVNQYRTATWRDVYGVINRTVRSNDTDEISPVSMFLLEEFAEFLKLTTLEHILAAARWTEDGESYYNTITLRYHHSMNRYTNLVANRSPEYHLEFKSEGYNAIAFSPNEWSEAVRQLPEEVVDGFLSGDFEPIADRTGETLATVGDPEGTRKLIESSPKDGNDRLVFQSRTEEQNSWYVRRPTLYDRDFSRFYEEEYPGPTFPDNVLPALFREGDLERVHELLSGGD